MQVSDSARTYRSFSIFIPSPRSASFQISPQTKSPTMRPQRLQPFRSPFNASRIHLQRHSLRPFASRLRKPLDIPSPFPVTKTCPEPSCACPPTPAMPEGLPIDYEQPLNGTMAAYAQQLLICTGQRDWTSRIEDDGEGKVWGELARGLRRLLGRGGRFADVC